MNPFNLKNALLARHAQHVVLIHFPIALFMAGVGFDFAASWTKRSALAAAAYYNLATATVFTPLVVATGFLAWHFQLQGQRFKGVLLEHLWLGIVSSLVIVASWNAHFRARRRETEPPGYRWVIEIAAVAIVGLTAHLGGFLSGVNGPS
jgi:uncharacterized membrane protein